MSLKYPNNVWNDRNGEKYIDDNGEITETANNWLVELSKLTADQIRVGMKNLAHRKNPAFPPSALEFVSHCLDMGIEDCADEIFEYIDSPPQSEWWWRSEVAFNVYIKLGYSPANNRTKNQVFEDIKTVYKRIDMHNLKPIPDRAVELPIKPPSKIERDRGKFQALMHSAIQRIRPDLFLSKPKNEIPNQRDFMQLWYDSGLPQEEFCNFVAKVKGMKADDCIDNLFMPHESNRLMIDWYRQKQPNMTDFLRNEGIAV